MKGLRSEILELGITLSAPQTKPTELGAPIFAASIPVEPKRRTLVPASMVAGLFFGLAYVVIRNKWRKEAAL